MITPSIRFLALAALMVLAGCSGMPPGVRSGKCQLLRKATKVEVFRLDPLVEGRKPAPEDVRIGGFLVIAQGKDQGAGLAVKLADVLSDNSIYTDGFPQVLQPRSCVPGHGNEGPSVDVIICFMCHNLYLGPPTDRAGRKRVFSPLAVEVQGSGTNRQGGVSGRSRDPGVERGVDRRVVAIDHDPTFAACGLLQQAFWLARRRAD